MSRAQVLMPRPRVRSFQTLLFRLPAELRLEVYHHALSLPRTTLNLLDDSREIQWLTVSRTIFLEAAALLYSKTPLYFPMDQVSHICDKSIHLALYLHAETTFLLDRKRAFPLLCEMVEKIIVDIPISIEDCQAPDWWECDCTLGRRYHMSSRDPNGHLSGPRLLASRRIPLMPAVEEVLLRFHQPYSLTREQSSSIEAAWQGEDMSEEVCDKLLRVAPFLHEVIMAVDSVNWILREKMPALQNVVWHLQHTVESPRWEARHATSAERFMELFIRYVGDCASELSKRQRRPV